MKDFETSIFHQKYPYDKKRYDESVMQLKKCYEEQCLKGKEFIQGSAHYAFTHDYYSKFFNAPNHISHVKSWYTGSCIPLRKLSVSPDGNIYICERVGSDRPIGHVDSGFDKNKTLAYFNDFLKVSEYCPECWARNRCSICPAEVDSSYDFDFKGRCEKVKKNIGNTFINLYSLLKKKPDLFIKEFEYF